MTALLEVRDLKKHYPLGRRLPWHRPEFVYAVDGISFAIGRGETLALVGESGCGKSTVGRSILRLTEVTSGEVLVDGRRVDALSGREFRQVRRRVQVVFQDPFASLNPRLRIGAIIGEPMRNFFPQRSEAERLAETKRLLRLVGLPEDAHTRLPHEFSGGQCQRIAIARALAAEPDILICDEAVSALDVSVKAQIVNLLKDIQEKIGLSLLFISHDLAIVDHISDRIAVMYLGKIVEAGTREEVFASPKHPYTQALLSAVPVPDVKQDRQRIILKGDIPSPIRPPQGCRFHTRCPRAMPVCSTEDPQTRQFGGQTVACHLYQ